MRDGWTMVRPGLLTFDGHEGVYVQANIVCHKCLEICWNAFSGGQQEDCIKDRDEAMRLCEDQVKGGEA